MKKYLCKAAAIGALCTVVAIAVRALVCRRNKNDDSLVEEECPDLVGE